MFRLYFYFKVHRLYSHGGSLLLKLTPLTMQMGKVEMRVAR